MDTDGVNPLHLNEDEVVAYLGHELTGEPLRRVERHLAMCAQCREEIVETGEILGRPGRPRWFRLTIGSALATAAAITAVLLLRPDRVPDPLAELGRVTQAPVYLGVAVRQVRPGADSVYHEAMSEYVAREFGTAVVLLDEALRAGADSAPTQFFRGASLQMLDRPEEAAAAFRDVIRQGGTPYLPEARYYLAKALLQLGRADEARSELREIADGTSEMAGRARALADSVEARMGG